MLHFFTITTRKRFELSIIIFYLLIKVPHSYSSDDTTPKSNHSLGNPIFRVMWHSHISIRFVTRYCVCSYKINIFRRVIYNFCCTLLCVCPMFCSSCLFILVDVASSIMILPWNSTPCNFSNSFCICSGITAKSKPLFSPFFPVHNLTRQFSCKYVVALTLPRLSFSEFPRTRMGRW